MAKFTPRSLDEHIIGAMARALWVAAYADEAEFREQGLSANKGRLRSARSGQDWMDVAPHTPLRAYMHAKELANIYIKLQSPGAGIVTVWQFFARACAADGLVTGNQGDVGYYDKLCTMSDLAAKFGHYLTMMALGHGVSWFDDHEEFILGIPNYNVDYDALKD